MNLIIIVLIAIGILALWLVTIGTLVTTELWDKLCPSPSKSPTLPTEMDQLLSETAEEANDGC